MPDRLDLTERLVERLIYRFDFSKVRRAMKGAGIRWVRPEANGAATVYFFPADTVSEDPPIVAEVAEATAVMIR